MSVDAVSAHARALWVELADVPVGFVSGQSSVVVSPGSRMCPAGWCGAVRVGDSVIVTAPDAVAAEVVREVSARISVRGMVVAERVSAALPVADMLGPAALAYASAETFRPVSAQRGSEQVLGEDAGLVELLESSGADDRAESGLDEITSPAFVVRSGGKVVSAAGYRSWPHRTAHVSVLTAPGRRGHGLARAAAGAAVEHALAQGLVPQWRARTPESRRVAEVLGFLEVGAQLSFRLELGLL